jgi:dolichol-phosphate mannosyltransferase
VIWTPLLLGLPIKDATAGFKCWRRAALEGIDLDSIRSNGYVFQVETVYLADQLGYRIVEVPIVFEDRRLGHSKMTLGVKLEAAWRVFEIRLHHRRARSGPLLASSYTNNLDR